MKYYTGIGSRRTPRKVLDLMIDVADKLRAEGYVLRSGGADGADLAFESGSDRMKQVFLPWRGFNKSSSPLFYVSDKVIRYSMRHHPNPNINNRAIRLIMGRNAQQVLGEDLDEPSKFVVCWTPKDALGGTGQAIRIANANGIPVHNLNDGGTWARVVGILESGSKLGASL